jgi:hypothetical protein
MDLGKPQEIIQIPEPVQIPDYVPAEPVTAPVQPVKEPVPA